VRERLPALAALAGHVADPAVRHRGTLGGAVAANELAGDYPAACLALNAVIHTNGRDVSAPDFFSGHRTALERSEIIVGVTFPAAERAAYLKFLSPASCYAMVGVFVALTQKGCRVTVTGAREAGAFRWQEAEEALAAEFVGARLQGMSLACDGLVEDLFADAAYRGHLAGVLARRAVAVANGSARDAVAIVHGAPLEGAVRG